MRPKFEGMKLEDLRRERDRWKKRAEEKQRFQGKKEEAWELFQRQPRSGTSRKQKVTSKRFSPFDLGPPDADEKSLQEWVDKLLVQALVEDRKKEARERQSMGQEDSNSQRRRAWEKSSRRLLQVETEPRRQTGRRAHCTGLSSGDSRMLEFDLKGACDDPGQQFAREVPLGRSASQSWWSCLRRTQKPFCQ